MVKRGPIPILASSSSECLKNIEKYREWWREVEGEKNDVFNNILVSPVMLSEKDRQKVKNQKDEYPETKIFVDSGSYLAEKGKINYGRLISLLPSIYERFEREVGGEWYVMPDYPPTGSEPDDLLEKKINITIENVVRFYKQSPDWLKEKAVAPVQGYVLSQIDRCIDAYIQTDINYWAFGSFPMTIKSKGVMIVNKDALLMVKHVIERASEYGVNLHCFGINAYPAIHAFTKLGVYSFDSSSWVRGPKYGVVNIPMCSTYKKKTKTNRQTGMDNDISEVMFRKLCELWCHECIWCNDWEEMIAPGNEHLRMLHGLKCLQETIRISLKMNTKEVINKFLSVGVKPPKLYYDILDILYKRSLKEFIV